MRIALFHDLPSGGAKRTLHELVKRLVLRHQIDLYSLATSDEQFADLRPLAAAHRVFPFAPRRLFRSPFGRLNQLQRWRDLRTLVQLGREIAASIDARGYDVLLADASMWTQAPTMLVSTSTPSVYNFHEPPRALYEPGLHGFPAPPWLRAVDRVDPLIALYRGAARRLDRLATRAATRVMVNSAFMQRTVRDIYDVEAVVARRGVDVQQFRPSAGTARRSEVLSVGSVQPSKGFDFIIASLAQIPAAARPPLRIVGNAETTGEQARLSRLAAAQGVELTIERDVPDSLLARRYAEAALFVYAPHREPLGLAALEAMSCATPVVGVADGGVVETVVDGVTGRLVRRDPLEFGAAVRELLADPDARRRLGDSAREHVKRSWTWDVTVARFEDTFAELAASPAVGPPATSPRSLAAR